MTTELIAAARVTGDTDHELRCTGAVTAYWMLTKPEITFMVGLAAGAAFCVGWREGPGHLLWGLLVHTLVGTVLVASGAGVLNQVAEREYDALMRRTFRRPIASCQIKPLPAFLFGAVLSLAGIVYLACEVRPISSILAFATLILYLLAYTPLKRRTPACTLIGAIPGAAPVLIGYIAASGRLDAAAWILYAVLFLWQFPHFMAIAWMYRDDYARAGYEVLPHGRKKFSFVVWQSLLGAIALLPVSCLPLVLRRANVALILAAVLLGLAFVCAAVRLALDKSNESARRLLVASLFYLPLVFLLQILARS